MKDIKKIGVALSVYNKIDHLQTNINGMKKMHLLVFVATMKIALKLLKI